MTALFEPFTQAGRPMPNRIGMSPMCQYRAEGDGVPTAWHDTHYRSRAVGGAGLILTEMTDVTPEGRITNGCLGLWNDAQEAAFARIADSVHAEGSAFGIQIAHAGRKSMLDGDILAPSAIPFAPDRKVPRALTIDEIGRLIEAFAASARRAARAGVDVVELHGAHGYLVHQFLSPISNQRDDAYGDPFRFALEVVEAVKSELPSSVTLWFRVSAREYQPGGYDETALDALLPRLVDAGVEVFDVSTGGNGPARPEVYPGYQLKYARWVRELTGVPVASVGALHHPALAEFAVREGWCDVVLIGKAMLRTPYWAHEAARALGVEHVMAGEYDKGV